VARKPQSDVQPASADDRDQNAERGAAADQRRM